jgi:hypothetical protein
MICFPSSSVLEDVSVKPFVSRKTSALTNAILLLPCAKGKQQTHSKGYDIMFAAIMIAIGRTRDGAFQQTAVEDEKRLSLI